MLAFPETAFSQRDWTEATTVHAEPSKPAVLWREMWVGADATEDGWLIFSGLTLAPFGHIHEQGWRFRIASGYGGYRYAGQRTVETFDPATLETTEHGELTKFEAETGFVDALVGYLWRFDPLIVKFFAGASGIGHSIAPHDGENLASGLEWGPKGVVELWLNMGEDMWGSLDATWTTAHETGSLRSRVGYRVWPKLSLGLEGRLNIDKQSACELHWQQGEACREQYKVKYGEPSDLLDYSRGGIFLRQAWEGGEVSASVGVSGASLGRASFETANPYATASWIVQW